MKKISLIALALTAGVAVFAQETQPQLVTPMAKVVRFGARAGLNIANLRAKDAPATAVYTQSESKTAFVGGLFVNIPLGSRNLRFQPEIAYSSQGGKPEGPSGSSAPVSYEQDLDYLTLPLNFQFMTNNGLFLQTGPQLGFLVGAERGSTTTGGSTNQGGNKDDFDKFDLAWSVGAGYLSRIGLGIDFRYNYGIANIVADDASASAAFPSGTTWKNGVAQFSLIYHFGAAK